MHSGVYLTPGTPFFFEKVTYFYSELNSLQNKAIFSLFLKTSMGSKSRKTVAGQGHFFGN